MANPIDSAETFFSVIWKSSIVAVFLTVPALGIFLGTYFATGELIVAAILGFGIHFVALAFSGRFSKWLVKVLS